MITSQSGPGHHLFVQEVRGLCSRFETNGIPPIEQIALLGQIIGGLISELDPALYSTVPVLHALMENVVAGNDAAGQSGPVAMRGRA